MDAVKINALTKKYKDVVAVDRLNLSINEGELFSLLGINGAGKTTTIKMLSLITKADSGDAFLMGKSIKTQSEEVKKLIAVSPQETAVAEALTVYENLELICNIGEVSKEKITEIIKLLDLKNVINKKAGKLSGGYKRRLSIAMALILSPKILFLDEPTLGLDVIARSELWNIIRSLKGKTTIILTTHYMEEAEELSDRIGIMKEGRLLVCETAENIKKIANADSFENAFIKIVKEEIK